MEGKVIPMASALAERTFHELTDGWSPDRDVFNAKPREIVILINGGAEIVKLNHYNGDKTFSHEVRFRNKRFVSCTTSKLEAA